MYHYQLYPQTQACRHLTSPCQHHLELAPPLSTFRDRLSTKPPLEREAGQPLEHHKTYTMPWQTCLVCPSYPFPSLLLLDPPALWQPSPPVNCAIPLLHHQYLPPDLIRQNQNLVLLNDPSPGTSKTLGIPFINGTCNKPTRSTLSRQDTTTQYHTRPQLSQVLNQPCQHCPKRPYPSRAQVLTQRQPIYIHLA